MPNSPDVDETWIKSHQRCASKASEQWFSVQGDFAIQKRQCFHWCVWGTRQGTPGMEWIEARDAAKHPIMYKTALPQNLTKNYST